MRPTKKDHPLRQEQDFRDLHSEHVKTVFFDKKDSNSFVRFDLLLKSVEINNDSAKGGFAIVIFLFIFVTSGFMALGVWIVTAMTLELFSQFNLFILLFILSFAVGICIMIFMLIHLFPMAFSWQVRFQDNRISYSVGIIRFSFRYRTEDVKIKLYTGEDRVGDKTYSMSANCVIKGIPVLGKIPLFILTRQPIGSRHKTIKIAEKIRELLESEPYFFNVEVS
ncbi:MAG: hypothetical protein LBV28_03745 [Puniceicoccales bacterium]|jgi:hypothetical protein|nr:hypothetical protein [Puniceicoccales bacterium]